MCWTVRVSTVRPESETLHRGVRGSTLLQERPRRSRGRRPRAAARRMRLSSAWKAHTETAQASEQARMLLSAIASKTGWTSGPGPG